MAVCHGVESQLLQRLKSARREHGLERCAGLFAEVERKAGRLPVRVRADLLAVAAQDLEDHVGGCPLSPAPHR